MQREGEIHFGNAKTRVRFQAYDSATLAEETESLQLRVGRGFVHSEYTDGLRVCLLSSETEKTLLQRSKSGVRVDRRVLLESPYALWDKGFK